MPGYNGKTTIDFHINRIKDIQTDEYRLVQEGDDLDREEELDLLIEGSSYFTPGRMHGLPENCYPDEGETEITSILWKGKPFPWDLTAKEKDEAEEAINLAVQEDDGPDPEDYDDSEDDYDDDQDDYDPGYDD